MRGMPHGGSEMAVVPSPRLLHIRIFAAVGEGKHSYRISLGRLIDRSIVLMPPNALQLFSARLLVIGQHSDVKHLVRWLASSLSFA